MLPHVDSVHVSLGECVVGVIRTLAEWLYMLLVTNIKIPESGTYCL